MAQAQLLLALAPLAGLTVHVAAHVVLSRLGLHGRPAAGIVLALAGALPVTVGLTVGSLRELGAAPADFAALLAMNLTTAAAFGYGYANFVNMNLASVRVRILKELLAAGRLSREELLAAYDEEEIITERIARLRRGRQIVERSGRFRIGIPVLLWIAEAIQVLKHLLLGRGSRIGG